MYKKFLALACSSILFLSTACAETPAENSEDTTEIITKSLIESNDIFPVENKLKYTIAGKRSDNYTKYGDTVFVENLEKQTNIDINWIDWSSSEYEEKVRMAIATNELPDAIYGGWLFNNEQLTQYVSDGYFLSFDEYLNAGYMPNFEIAIAKNSKIRTENTMSDGKLYALPSINEEDLRYVSNNSIAINTTWLDKVNMPMPTTTSELKDVLLAFKNSGDLNGNSEKDEIPLSFIYGDNVNGIDAIIGWFGKAGTVNKSPSVENGKLYYVYNTDNYKQAMIYLNDLYENDLIDKEIFTSSKEAYTNKSESDEPIYGVVSIWSTYLINQNASENKYEYLPPLSAENGTTAQHPSYTFSYNRNPGFVISSNCENPEYLAAWADLWYDVENGVDAYYGGSTYIEKIEDNKYRFKDKEIGYSADWLDRSWYSPANGSLSIMLQQDITFESYSLSEQNKLLTNEIYGDYVSDEQYNQYWFMSSAQSSEIKETRENVVNYINDMAIDFITNGNVEEKWDEYISHLDELGLPRMLSIQQSIYDANK